MVLHFAAQFFCLVVNCLPTPTPVVVVQKSPSSIQSSNSRFQRTLNFESDFQFRFDTTIPPIVRTDNGLVQGYYQKTIGGRDIAAFESIPYGKSTSGFRRFKKPEPMDPWNGIRMATSKPPPCLQMDIMQAFRVHGSETCLFLSVYTPTISHLDSLPVIVFIHGGGFQSLTSGDLGAAYYLDSNVVLVTINYRLGVLGFLSMGDDAASGNWGMKDQVLALKWVQSNIKNFGGNPSLITLQGESAGAASVNLHIVSKMSRGLFHRAICQSGSSLNHWAIQNDTISNSKLIARGVNCPTDNSQAMVNCLRQRDPNWIVARMWNTWKYLTLSRLPFGPVIETNSSEQPFIDEAPHVTYEKGQVPPIPMIIGANQNEGALFAATIYLTPLFVGMFNRDFNKLYPYSLAYDSRTNSTDEVTKKLRDFYLAGKGMSFYNRKGWSDMLGDRTILQGVYYGMQHHSKVAPTYGYVLSFQDKNSILEFGGLDRREWGVSHGDDLLYFFNTTMASALKVEDRGFKMSKFLIDIWINFAITGKPLHTNEEGNKTEFWDAIEDPLKMQVLSMNEVTQMIPMPFQDRLQFWQSLNLKDDHYQRLPSQ